MSFTAAPEAWRRRLTSSTAENLRSSLHGKRSSGVLTTAGSASRISASERSARLTMPSSRTAA